LNLDHRYDGGCLYLYEAEVGPHRLLIAVSCLVGDLPDPHFGLIDTGSPWCVMPPQTASMLGCEPAPGEPPIRMATRLGTFEGWLERVRLQFPAALGALVSLEATWFVSPDWPGPLVIGWKGGLERIRCALDPTEEAFYFGIL
jgi:hypothetical protein